MKTLFLIAAGVIASLGLLAAVSAQPALAASATLPITNYYQMVVDATHGHIFISQGLSSEDGILVTDLTGQVITTIPNQDGVLGLALSPDGSTLYAALSATDAVTAISTATLTQTASFALPAGDSPDDVAVQSGKIWVSYDTGTLYAAGIGYFDPSASSPTLQTPANMGGWSDAPQIAADPTDTGVLVAIESGGSGPGLASYDTAANPVTTIAGSPSGSTLCGTEEDLAVAPGGAQFAVACHDPEAVDTVYSTASLSPVRSLGSTPYPAYPVAIAYDGAGDIAAGSTTYLPNPDLSIYPAGDTTAVNAYTLYTLATRGGVVAPRGLAWLPDGSQVFGVLDQFGSYALVSVANPTVPQVNPTTTSVDCEPPSVVVGQVASCTAVVTDTGSGPTTPTGVVTAASDTSGGSFSGSPCTLAADSDIGQAACTFSYTPGQAGSNTQTITGNYGGDSSHAASSGHTTLSVTLSVTSTVLTCKQVKPANPDRDECTATVVDDTPPGPAAAPTGTVSFSSSGSGVFSATHCTLSSSGTSASCAVYYRRPSAASMKAQTITASYSGDSAYQSSTGTFKLKKV